jgi:hypothetical protein
VYTNLVEKPERQEDARDVEKNYFIVATIIDVLINTEEFCCYAMLYRLKYFVKKRNFLNYRWRHHVKQNRWYLWTRR